MPGSMLFRVGQFSTLQAPTQMNELKPKKAADNPLAAALLGSVLVKAGNANHDPAQVEAGMDLIKIAQANQDKMPRFNADSPLVTAIRATKSASSDC